MTAYIWMFLLIAIAIISFILGMTFLVLDLQKPKSKWHIGMFLTDIALLVTFFVSSAGAVYVYLLFQKQIEFFS
ncbi:MULTISPECIES: hypothetical protein [Enterococcus]|jgi:formate-dependent nitrite reductase membrane component NrfD|uniref:Uncharacterized protein n=1 Tax=Enterococcus entomosocium TaxID=3034352 RepID=A0ABV3MFY8_9ENTE|nr:hypothetical protein [Enterococcus casseliflavus]EPH92739.1 hypothetical protein D922_02367 [Enterococcus faecalis 06-MB-DW-09]MDB1710260.1 hypothetical protein [Enterococcus casseliflavus]MDB1717927.1 hypothetical protein [Enterococcus casseliflavus]MDF2534582.1 hypothetical protein [Bacillales bacterium]